MLWQAIALWLAATHSTVRESGGEDDKEEKADEFWVVEVDMVVGHMAVEEVSRAFCCLHVAVFNWDGCGGTEQQRSPETRSEICQD